MLRRHSMQRHSERVVEALICCADSRDVKVAAQLGFFVVGQFPVTAAFCANCHTGSGIHSVISVASLLKPSAAQRGDSENYRYEGTATLFWKQDRYDWGLLDGYRKNVPVE
jgi:hypothetical protein